MADSAILARYFEGVELLTRSLADLSDAEVDFTPGPGKWSVRQIAAHLADTELVSAYRFRLIISEENPAIIPFDQEAWAQSLNYAQRSPAESLEDFRYLRSCTCELL